MLLSYGKNLVDHLTNFYHCAMKLGVNVGQIKEHDRDKWNNNTFEAYAYYFFDENGNKRESHEKDNTAYKFDLAVAQHYRENPHHPEYWNQFKTSSAGASGLLNNGMLLMPEEYLLEMIADWQASSLTYEPELKGDLTKWLTGNWHLIELLHPESRNMLIEMLLGRELVAYDLLHDLDENRQEFEYRRLMVKAFAYFGSIE